MGTIRQLQPAAFPPPHSSAAANAMTNTCSRSRAAPPPTCSNKTEQQHSSSASHSSKRSSWSPCSGRALSCSAALTVAVVVVLCSAALPRTLANPVFVDNPSLAQFQSGRNIRHLPCIVRKSGRTGVCMFAIDCIKQNGTHLGTCIDRFYFGSCCQMKDDTAFAPELSDNSIDQNTISHFAHESTTLPSSALFKLTTEPLVHVHSSSSKVPLPLRSNATTTATQQTRRPGPQPPLPPQAQQPTKHSQFVVRTTGRPISRPATAQPPRRRPITTTMTTTAPPTTTPSRPVLTTAVPPKLEQRIELTTAANKLYTFQMVETTTPSAATEAAKTEQTTLRPLVTRRPRPPVTALNQPASSNATSPRPQTPTWRPPPPVLTTGAPHRPAANKRPAPPSGRPTLRPPSAELTTMMGERIRPSAANKTAAPPKQRPTIAFLTTTTPATSPTPSETRRPATRPSTAQTTRAPRPKPKPTAEIVKVPKPAVLEETPPAAVATKRPKPTKTTTTTTTTSSSTTTTTTTRRPKPTQTPRPTATTTEPPAQSDELTTPSARPGLVTWTDADAEPVTNATGSEEWHAQPPNTAADWVPLPTIAPEAGDNKTTGDGAVSSLGSTSDAPNASTEKIIISVSTSISELLSNGSVMLSRPERLPGSSITTTLQGASSSHTTTTTTTSTTTTTTKAPRPKPKPTPAATTTTSTTSTTERTTAAPTSTTTSTTRRPITTTTSTTTTPTTITTIVDFTTEEPTGDWNNTGFAGSGAGGGIDASTEDNFGGTGSSTLDYSTEQFNATMEMMSTTTTPPNLLEGMDYREICGRRMFPEPRIVGGSNAAFGRWPWQISLRQWRTSTYLHKCGAALLNENWAITAAHCVDNVPPSDLLLRLGEYDLAEEEEPYGYQERRVQIVASHPQFDPRTFEYDLALLRFYEPVIFQPNIIPVCVPNNDLDFIGQTAFVTGWGRLYEDGPLPSVLQEVAVPVINNTICESMYRTAGYIEHIPHIFICAGWKKGGYDSCEGDSGGPMVLQREDDKRFQLGGVISWGIGCAEANQPGVYTRISEFRDWINQILQF